MRVLLLVLALTTIAHADSKETAKAIYQQLVETDTSQSNGDTFAASVLMAKVLQQAGIPQADVHVFQTAPKRGNLVARLRGTGKKKPLLLVAHIDVVEAKKEDWSTDPYKFVEKDGYFYGRGTGDDKAMAAILVAMFADFARAKYKPDRDLILALECDEEISDANGYGMRWLIANQKALIDAELALNEGGGVGMKDGKPVWNSVQTTEKLFQSFWLEVKNPGGHSSQPRADNAIYQLAAGLGRLEKYQFPFELSPTTRGYFETMAKSENAKVAADIKAILAAKPDAAAIARLSTSAPYNAQMRTTCVPTRLEGGHADNALPQVAKAMVNCRILPGHEVAEVQAAIEKALADPKIVVTTAKTDTGSKPSAIPPELSEAIGKLSKKYWPGAPIMPVMSPGATDGRFLRNAGIPTFGHTGIAGDIFDVRAHGKDERVSVKAFFDAYAYQTELVRLLAGGS